MKKVVVFLVFLSGCGGGRKETPQEALERAARVEKWAAERAAQVQACNLRATKGSHDPTHRGEGSCSKCPCHKSIGATCSSDCSPAMDYNRKGVTVAEVHEVIGVFGSKLKPKSLKQARKLAQELCACACEH